jgi:YggT family protein
MGAIHYILDTLGTLYNAVLLLRLIMQLVRADFRNPIGRAIVQLTDPLVRPLRRVLPPAGRVDTASVVAVLLFALVKTWLLRALLGFISFDALALLRATLLEVIHLTLNTYFFSIVLNALLSFFPQGGYSPPHSVLASICNPVLNPIRRIIPSIAGLDLSPLWACIAIQALLRILPVA